MGGADQDGVLERLWLSSAAGAGQVRVLVEQGGVGGQVTLCPSHLVDPPSHELPQAHERMRGEGGGVLVVWGCGCIGGTVLAEHVFEHGSGGPGKSFSYVWGREC